MLACVRRWDVESCFFKKDKPKNTTKHLVGVACLQKNKADGSKYAKNEVALYWPECQPFGWTLAWPGANGRDLRLRLELNGLPIRH